MPKSDFIPAADNDLLIWLNRFAVNLALKALDYGISDSELAELKTWIDDLNSKIAAASDAAAAAKQATSNKNDCRKATELKARALARRIKAHPLYNAGQGDHLGVEGPEIVSDLSQARPVLSCVDQTGGLVALGFSKSKSDGINVYSQREGDGDWVLLGRATVSPFLDKRPLLAVGKPELRRYTAVYMQKDQEIGVFSDDAVVNCAP